MPARTQKKRSAVSSFLGMKFPGVGEVMLDVYGFCSMAESREIPSEVPGKRLIIRTACACAEKTPATARGIPLP